MAPNFSLRFSPAQIETTTKQVIEEASKIVAEFLSSGKRDFDSCYLPFHRSETIAAEWSCKLVLASMVHTDKAVRDAATIWKGNLKQWFEERYSNKEIFGALKAAATDGTGEDRKRLVEITLAAFKRNGAHLPLDITRKLADLKSRISKLEYEFQSNLGEDLSSIEVSEKDLEGCAVEFIESLDKAPTGDRVVTCKPPHVRAVMEACKIENTRKRMLIMSQSRCKVANANILRELVCLRAEAASLLGYKSWADYKLDGTMAGSPIAVWDMLHQLDKSIKGKLSQEVTKLKEEKRNAGNQTEFGLWDLAFHEKLHLKNNYNIDDKLVKQYLPMQFCIRSVMSIYEYLFGIKFMELRHDSLTWHPDVYLFSVKDGKTDSQLGFLFLDLFSRPGKYAHQCVIPLSTGTNPGGHPVVANISNLSSKGDAQNPALLAHGELITFFHEFGHAVHALVGPQRYPVTSWSWKAVPYEAGVEIDFLEVPSKGFEFFAWEKDVLKRVTCHYQQLNMSGLKTSSFLTDLPPQNEHALPADLVDRILRAKHVFSGYDYERMVFMTAFDMLVHSIPASGELQFSDAEKKVLPKEIYEAKITLKDVTVENMLKWWAVLQKAFVSMDAVPGTNPLANWYHLAMGYDAGYYGYLWSETVAADIYKTLFKGNLSQPNGHKLREVVLSKEASEPALSMVKNLLGRPPNSNALIEDLLS